MQKSDLQSVAEWHEDHNEVSDADAEESEPAKDEANRLL